MHWNCPHCGTSLTVQENELTDKWTFARCFQCTGYAMVRRNSAAPTDVRGVKTGPAHAAQTQANLTTTPQPSNDICHAEETAPPAFGAFLASAAIRGSLTGVSSNTTHQTAKSIDLNHLDEAEILPEQKITRRSRYLSTAIVAASTALVISGLYLYDQGKQLWSKATALKSTQPIGMIASAKRPNRITNITQPTVIDPSLARDRITHQAMAPDRGIAPATNAQQVSNPSMKIRSRVANAILRSGPGLEHADVGRADQETEYTVIEWKDRWFKVQIGEQSAWIRNDLVQIASD